METLSPAALQLLAHRFKLLSSPTRLSIMQHICHDERTVSELIDLTGFKQANLSRQLSLLHRGGLARRRSEGTSVYYTAADESLPKLCMLMRESILSGHGELLESLGK